MCVRLTPGQPSRQVAGYKGYDGNKLETMEFLLSLLNHPNHPYPLIPFLRILSFISSSSHGLDKADFDKIEQNMHHIFGYRCRLNPEFRTGPAGGG